MRYKNRINHDRFKWEIFLLLFYIYVKTMTVLIFFMPMFLSYGDPSVDSWKSIDWYLYEGKTGMKKVKQKVGLKNVITFARRYFWKSCLFSYLKTRVKLIFAMFFAFKVEVHTNRTRLFNQTILAVKRNTFLYQIISFSIDNVY